MTALAGKVSAYAYIYVPRFGWPPTEKKTYDFVLWDEPGVSFKGHIWNLKDLNGNRVNTGVYLVYATNSAANDKLVGKIAVIK